MKKLKGIGIFCLTLFFMMSACALFAEGEKAEEGAAPKAAAKPKPESFEGVHLRVAMIDEEREWAFRDLLPEFKQMTGIEVTIDTYGFEDLFNKVLTASAAHTGEYDVYQFHFPDMALFDERGYMLDITEWVMRDADEMELDDIHPSLQDSHMKYKGRWFGVATHVGSMTFYYRKDIFQKEGYKVPKTWEEVLTIAKDIDAKYAPDMRGFVYMGRADIQGAATFINFLGAYGGDFYDHNTFAPTINSPEALKAMRILVKLQNYSVEGSPGYGFDEGHVAFQQGRAAMLPFWDSGDGFFSDPKQSDIIGKWGVAPMPGARATNGGWSVQISADSENPEAAWEFLKWIVSPEMEKRLVPLKPSCRTSILTDPQFKKYPSYQGFYNVLEGNPFGFPKITPNWQMLQLLGQAVNQVMTGMKTPEAALNWLQEQYKVILLRYDLWKP
jgi:multiple sugar transport system substrate-binding protein